MIAVMTTTDEPRVWLGCLACYNGGDLVGEWMTPGDAAEATSADIHHGADLTRMTHDVANGYGEHEELWVMDHELTPITGEFGQIECAAIAEAFEEIGADEWPAYLAYAATGMAGAPVPDVDDFRESYAGEFASREDYAQELAEDLGAIPAEYSWPASYIDWQAAARDLFMDYYDAPAPGGIYVFRAL